MFHPIEQPMDRGWVGRVDGDRVLHLAAQTLQAFFTGGSRSREHAEYALADVRLLPPVLNPPTIRGFMAFEGHVARAWGLQGRSVPDEWYLRPAFSFLNASSVYGPEEEIPYPAGTGQLDYGLGVAAVIGADGAIGGFTIMNDWSARDVLLDEVKLGIGPSKGKDFATSFGPVVATPDELGDLRLEMVARVNGEERSRGNLGAMQWSWRELVDHAARNTVLRAGDLIGSGTVTGGSILEQDDGRWLEPGDVVELEVDGIGILRNTIGPAA
jgi:fumarylacetoacetate (FAA) hydrolase